MIPTLPRQAEMYLLLCLLIKLCINLTLTQFATKPFFFVKLHIQSVVLQTILTIHSRKTLQINLIKNINLPIPNTYKIKSKCETTLQVPPIYFKLGKTKLSLLALKLHLYLQVGNFMKHLAAFLSQTAWKQYSMKCIIVQNTGYNSKLLF